MDLARTGARLFLIALPPYFAWEMLQAPAFTGMPPGWWAATAVCARATLGDGVIVLVVFAIGALLFRDWRWFAPPSAGRYAAVVLAGVVVQVLIEWLMVHGLGRWGYKPWHPVVPVLDVGLLVVLQPIPLLPLVFWALAHSERPDRDAARECRAR